MLTAQDGTPTGTIYGFLNGLSYAMHQVGASPISTTICWDGGRSEERIKLYPSYKANRKKKVEDEQKAEQEEMFYRYQCSVIRDLLGFRTFRQVKVGGVEADDVIGILTALLKKSGRVVIYSGDQDFWQLYAPGVVILDPKRGILTPADIENKVGVPVQDLLLWKALVGDPSDNIKGVDKIGTKRAMLICHYLQLVFKPRLKIKPKPGVESWEQEGSKAKHIDRCLERATQNVIKRNVRLMQLPRSVEESFLTLEQAEDMLVQWSTPGKDNTRKFFAGLTRFGIENTRFNNW